METRACTDLRHSVPHACGASSSSACTELTVTRFATDVQHHSDTTFVQTCPIAQHYTLCLSVECSLGNATACAPDLGLPPHYADPLTFRGRNLPPYFSVLPLYRVVPCTVVPGALPARPLPAPPPPRPAAAPLASYTGTSPPQRPQLLPSTPHSMPTPEHAPSPAVGPPPFGRTGVNASANKLCKTDGSGTEACTRTIERAYSKLRKPSRSTAYPSFGWTKVIQTGCCPVLLTSSSAILSSVEDP